jgi:hypothetical protein
VTVARVLLTLSGFISLINGVIQLGPQASPPERATGVALVVVGLLTWALVWRLPRLGRAAVRLTTAVAVAIAAARVAQFAVVHAPTILLAVVVPLVALLLALSAWPDAISGHSFARSATTFASELAR